MFLFYSIVLFICSLFIDAVNKSGHTMSKDQVAANEEMERKGDKAVEAYFKVLSSHLLRGTERKKIKLKKTKKKKKLVSPGPSRNSTLHHPNTSQKRSPLRQLDNFV
jgi:hypothetical protein